MRFTIEHFDYQSQNSRRYIRMRKMIAYCGLDCEKCDAYIATINDDQT